MATTNTTPVSYTAANVLLCDNLKVFPMHIPTSPQCEFHKQSSSYTFCKVSVALLAAGICLPILAHAETNALTQPVIQWPENLPTRPADLENPTPNGFVDETVYTIDAWTGNKKPVSLTESRTWNTDVILNYTKASGDRNRLPNPIEANTQVKLDFTDHTLRLFTKDMTGGTAISSKSKGDLTLVGNKLEVLAGSPQYVVYADGGDITLDVDDVWLEGVGDSTRGLQVVRSQGDVVLNSNSFVAISSGELKQSYSSNPSSDNAIFSVQGNLAASGGNYFLHVADGTANANYAVGVHVSQSSNLSLGSADQALNLLSVTGVGYGFYFEDYRDGNFLVNADNLYVETVSKGGDTYGIAIYADGDMHFQANLHFAGSS